MRNDFSSKSGRSKASGGKKQPKVRPEVEPKTKSRPSRCKIDFDKLALDATEEELAEWENRAFDAYVLQQNLNCIMRGYFNNPYPADSHFYTGPDGNRKFRDIVWSRVAKLCWHYGVIPEEYLAHCFSDGFRPYPNVLLQEAAIKRCVSSSRRAACEESLRITAQTDSINIQAQFGNLKRMMPDATDAEVWYGILLGEPNELSTFFRYAFAAAMGGEVFKEVQQRYEDTALWLYLANSDAYDAVWEDRLPLALQERARPYLARRNRLREDATQ